MNRRFTDEMLALILVSRTRRMRKRRQMEELNRRDGHGHYTDRPPRYVSNSEFFAAKLTPTLANPNALCFKRIQVVN